MLYRASYILALFVVSLVAYRCSSGGDGKKPLQEVNGLKLFEMEGSKDYPQATLKLRNPTEYVLPGGKDSFEFEVTGFELGAQTPDADQKLCANSAQGQHIHFIMDNKPYKASYTPQIEDSLGEGHHVLLAFLSRSYHESIKQKSAFILQEYHVGDSTIQDNFDENAPHLFYSRPKGEYIGDKEVQRLMLDFYLVNCDLSENGYKVKATVNGNQFTLTKWAPYYIEGLPLGEVTVKLELLDAQGALVSSPFNGVERTCTLKTEPLK